MKISVIIAAYNAEKYLAETLDSIVSQTIDDYEILVVNDGSTDSTLEILESYAQDYSRLKVIDKENGGPSSARNKALDVAKGEFVYFLDADDIVELDALQCLYERAVEQKADLVIAKYDIFNQYRNFVVNDLNQLVMQDKIEKYDPQILWTFSLWNKLFRRSVIEEYRLRFAPISYSEDGAFTMNFVYQSNRITGLDKVILHYRRMADNEADSITASISQEKIRDYIEAHRLIYKAARKSILVDYPKYETIEQAKDQNEEIHKYIQTISRKELQILLDHFYGKFWSIEEDTVKLLVDEMMDKLQELDMRDISLLADAHPEYSFAHLYVKQEDVLRHAFCSFVLYGETDEEEEFLKVLQSVTVQNLISLQILVPAHMKDSIRQAGLLQNNIVFADVKSEDEMFYDAIDKVRTEYIVFGNICIAYANNAFKYAFKRFLKSPADFIIELIYHRNYGDIQAVLLNNIALNSQKSGYEVNEFLGMDYTLANKFFRTSFLKDHRFDKTRSLLSQLPDLYRTGYYTFLNDAVVFYERAENTFAEFVGTKETLPFIQEYLRDKKADLNSAEIVADPGEVLPKLMSFPEDTFSQRMFRKIVSLFRRSKVKNQVLFFTIRKNGELEGNAKALYPYVKGKKIIRARLLPHSYLEELKMYYAMITSKVIVTDDYNRYLRYFPLRKRQRVIQLWHACGAFKKFGRRGTNLSIFTDGATHAQYNMVTVSGEYIRSIYADAFNLDPNKIKALGCPRTDDFFDPKLIADKKEKIYTAYPEFRGKFIIIYAPTFRDIKNNRQEFHPELDFERLSKELLPDQMFIVCPHPIMQNAIVEKKYENIRVVRDFSTNDMMFVSDLLVTDYSSVIFEYALLQKPIAFFCYDLSTYNRGFYLNYPEDLPGDVYETQDALTEYLVNRDRHELTEKYKTFVERYMSACDGHSCERIAGLINAYMEEDEDAE